MIWIAKNDPRNGDTRIITKFLFIPKCINGEWRWLELVTYKQKFQMDYSNYDDFEFNCWDNICWI